jgi:hypothetical protein
MHATVFLTCAFSWIFQVGELRVGKSTFVNNLADSFGDSAVKAVEVQKGGGLKTRVEYEQDSTVCHFCFEVCLHPWHTLQEHPNLKSAQQFCF